MDRIYKNIIFFSILAGLLFWLFDAVWDKFIIFPNTPFWNVFIFDIPPHGFYSRPTVLLIITIFVLVFSIMLKKVRESDNKYQQLIENVNDAVFVQPFNNDSSNNNYSLNNIEVNNVACSMLGYTKEELLNLSSQKIIDPEKKDDFALQMEILRKEYYAMFETVFLRKDGSKVPVEVSAHVLHFGGEPISLAIVKDISSMLEVKKELLLVADRLTAIREEEKGRISKELHDDLGQNLLFLQMEISSLRESLPTGLVDIKGKCGSLLRHLSETVESVSRLCQELKPQGLEELGFGLATNLLIKEFCELYGIKSYAIEMDDIDYLLPPEAQLNLYRVFQETLTNIGKHARATAVSIVVKKTDNQIFITIRDNGKGFDVIKATRERKGLGLTALRERALALGGEMKIHSHLREGTTTTLMIPLENISFAQGGTDHEIISHFTG